MTHARKRILLLLNWYIPRLHRGIMDYTRSHNCFLEVAHARFFHEMICSWQGDAVITDMSCDLEMMRERGLKIALCINSETGPGYADCIVCPDDEKIGVLAAEYFLQKGFRNFAVCSPLSRRAGFCGHLARSGYAAIPIPLFDGKIGMEAYDERMAQLAELPRPCAVFCENDWVASGILNQAHEAGIRVPEELSVLGVGNDDLCNSAPITLSSIETRLYERGYRLAEELDNVLKGNPGGKVMIAPSTTVIERGSSDSYAVTHPLLREMLAWLAARASSPVQIGDLAERFNLSVSAVYRLFTSQLGLAPKKVLLDIRMNIAHRLLLNTELKVVSVAREAGFPSAASFFEAFQKAHARTPNAWRNENR